MKRILSAILFIAIFFLGVSFALKNQQTVKIHYYFDLEWGPFPLSLVIIGVLLLGILIGGLITSFPILARRRQVRRLRRQMAGMEKELTRLRKLPPQEESRKA